MKLNCAQGLAFSLDKHLMPMENAIVSTAFRQECITCGLRVPKGLRMVFLEKT